MKMKYFFTALLAALSTVFVSCSDDNTITTMAEFQLSTSYVSLPMDSGSVYVDVVATEAWMVTAKPKWLTVDSIGKAGASKMTFTAGKTLDGRTGEVIVTLEGGKTHRINVIQGLATISEATVAEVMAGPDSKTYMVKGTVTKITETAKYGNFYMNDGTHGTDLYIYGTKYNGQTQQAALEKLGVEVGDEIIVSGPKTTYNGTVELVDVDVIKLNKSLIKVDSTTIKGALPIEGGEFSVILANKGQGVYVEIPEDAKSWLSIAGVQGNTIMFKAAANEGGDRGTTIVFKTTDGKKDYTAELAVDQKGAIIACSIADFNAAAVGSTVYRLTGIVSSVANAGKGRFYIYDYSGETYVYNYADFATLGAKVGDIVTVIGKRDQYNETIEMTGGKIEEVKYVDEVTIPQFLKMADDNTTYYMVSGTIDEIANASFGNLYLKDEAGTRLYVYGCYPGWGATGDARKGVVDAKGLKVGDKLTVIGVKSTYKDVPQVNGGYYFSHTPAN